MNSFINGKLNSKNSNASGSATFLKKWSIIVREKEMRKLLDIVGMTDYKIIRIDPHTRKGTERYSVSLLVEKHNDNNSLVEVIIDFRLGNPTWEQFIDVTYDAGSKYDKKIIIFEYDFDEKGFSNVPDAVCEIEDLVKFNNKSGVETYLVEAKGLIKYFLKGEGNDIGYSLVNGPYGYDVDNPVPVSKNRELAQSFFPKKDVRLSEFWLGYYRPNWGDEESNYNRNSLVVWTPRHRLSHDLRTITDWNDDGLFIDLAEYEDSEDIGAIQWIWNHRKALFEETYPERSICLKYNDGQPIALSVRIYGTPVTELIEMAPKAKWLYCKMVYGAEHKFRQIAEKAIEDYDKMTKINNVIAA